MYLQHASLDAVYKLKYFTPVPDNTLGKETFLNHDLGEDVKKHGTGVEEMPRKRRSMKSFLEPDNNAFARIRKRLSTLSLNTAYRQGLESPLITPFSDNRSTPRRVSSISSRDSLDRKHGGGHKLAKTRGTSRNSFLSEDLENVRLTGNAGPRSRASETAALNKFNEHVLTPRQNPDLFSRQIKLRENKESGKSSRSTSPKSCRSIESTGKVHLGLIESLDLNETLSDVEKLKARYSNDEFMNSLTLYKLRGHDRCFNHNGHSEHVRRGTVLYPLEPAREPARAGSNLTWESGCSIDPSLSPRLSTKPDLETGTRPVNVNQRKEIRVADSDTVAETQVSVKRKKSVDFDMELRDSHESHVAKSPLSQIEILGKERELKSILKRSKGKYKTSDKDKDPDIPNQDDEFLKNESYHWRFHLPKLRSPVQNRRQKPTNAFQRKMYHFGEGVSREFEQVICTYGNCRQSSIIRDKSLPRDQSFTREPSKVK